jgi:hypothetical protein
VINGEHRRNPILAVRGQSLESIEEIVVLKGRILRDSVKNAPPDPLWKSRLLHIRVKDLCSSEGGQVGYDASICAAGERKGRCEYLLFHKSWSAAYSAQDNAHDGFKELPLIG